MERSIEIVQAYKGHVRRLIVIPHILPDKLHFDPAKHEAKLRSGDNSAEIEPEMDAQQTLGCMVVVDKDEKDGVTYGRSMDWLSLGIFGTYSYVLVRKYTDPDYLSTIGANVPGSIGSLSEMNEKGLCLSVNVCSDETRTSTQEIRGMPTVFYNRMCAEKCLQSKKLRIE